ncbi:MAG: hypothetical protein PHU85_14585 [Phycisphaerae bacterium]|nr:hypothetical protein [Phycisphaerae bacterium]
MTHDALGDLRMRPARSQQTARCVAKAMEVGKPSSGVLVRQETALPAFSAFVLRGGVGQPGGAGVLQVRLEHAGRVGPALGHVERRGVGQLAGQEVQQRGGGVGPQGQGVFAAMLRVAGGDADRRPAPV